MANKGGEREPQNVVAEQAIIVENIRKINKSQRMYTSFHTNPNKTLHQIKAKPNTVEAEAVLDEEDKTFLKIIGRSEQLPPQKYNRPQTEAQEVGWITKPLMKHDRMDRRLYFPRMRTEMTEYIHLVLHEREQKSFAKMQAK